MHGHLNVKLCQFISKFHPVPANQQHAWAWIHIISHFQTLNSTSCQMVQYSVYSVARNKRSLILSQKTSTPTPRYPKLSFSLTCYYKVCQKRTECHSDVTIFNVSTPTTFDAIYKVNLIQLSPASHYFLPFSSKYFLQVPLPKYA